MEFESPEIVSVNPSEPLLVINSNAFPVEVGSAITFKQDGVYLVTVKGKQIIIEKWEGQRVDKYVKGSDIYDIVMSQFCASSDETEAAE